METTASTSSVFRQWPQTAQLQGKGLKRERQEMSFYMSNMRNMIRSNLDRYMDRSLARYLGRLRIPIDCNELKPISLSPDATNCDKII